MRDLSIFQGWKEFKGPRGHLEFENKGLTWHVYQLQGGAFVHIGIIRRIKRESNASLYRRGCELLEE